MSVERALRYYQGTGGQKMNCAQSVALAFAETFPLEDERHGHLARFGGGRAPGGLCGALYAAEVIAERYAPGRSAACRDAFCALAGDHRCRSIRSARAFSCSRCVETAARWVASLAADVAGDAAQVKGQHDECR